MVIKKVEARLPACDAMLFCSALDLRFHDAELPRQAPA